MFPNLSDSITIPCFVLLGAVFIMFVYHFLLYIQYRESVILKYCLYLMAIGLYLPADLNARADHALRNNFLADGFNFIAILTYADFIIETLPVSRDRFKKLFTTWRLITWATVLYVGFCFILYFSGLNGFENAVHVMNNIFRVIYVMVGIAAAGAFFSIMNNRFLKWIKWGAISYLFIMAIVMYVMLVDTDMLLLGLSPIHYVYMGTLCDVIIFSVAMSLKIKELVIKVTEIRNRLSRDLHDDIGASLSSIQIYSTVAEKAMHEDAGKAKYILQQIRQNAGKVMEDMGDIVWAMKPQEEGAMSISNRIKNYGSELLSHKNIECDYRIDQQAEQKQFTPESRKNILLIVKEAINNIAKYSEASNAEIQFSISGNDLVILISDNGKGFQADDVLTGNGLKHIRQRAGEMGGDVEFSSNPGKGTKMNCRIPLTNISDNGYRP
ncbi:MAG TPA: sensor histidine kinase [Ferruginibacter sp.]|nr:sensor histidine kinase [Ferruginibacter sp.]